MALASAAPAPAQQGPGPLPEGPGRIAGRVIHPDGPKHAAGVPVVLYGLSATGQSGVADTITDDVGAFAFEGVSNDEGMAYLVGARYREIPFFGPRVAFAAGETEATAELEVADPITDATDIRVAEVIARFDWAGHRLAVQEIHRLRSSAPAVVFIAADHRDGLPAPFQARLPEGAEDFAARSMGFEDMLEESDGTIRFWGPIYPGGQELRFQYTLPFDEGADGDSDEVVLRLPVPVAALSILTTAGGPHISAPGPLGAEEESEIDGQPFRVRRLTDVAAGSEVRFSIARPSTSSDIARVSLERADAWLELDDTQLETNLQIQLSVAGSERIASGSDEPLMRIPLPAGAAHAELSPEALALGIESEGDAILVRGPLPPGESRFGVRFRLAPTPEGLDFDLRFPLDLAALNVIAADTGLIVASDRLHRRRPFRQGTRIYLHREAFNIAAQEPVNVSLRALDESGLSNAASAAVTFASVLAAALFLALPLLRARTMSSEPAQSTISIQREALYQDIRDLDHDFETGKLAEADHREMRAALRARAVALLQRERGTGGDEPADAPEATPSCPSCREPVDTSWTFCSHCGASLGSSR